MIGYDTQAMKKYEEAPWWWYMILLVLSFVAGTSIYASLCRLLTYGSRLDCGLQRADHASVVVVHRGFDPRRLCYSKLCFSRLSLMRGRVFMHVLIY